MKILYLTSVYKDLELKETDRSTNISNTFAEEWIKLGHEVIVIHSVSRFPKIIYGMSGNIKNTIERKIGNSWGNYCSVTEKKYLQNGVKIYRLPMSKYIPHKSPSTKRINKQVDKIKKILEDNKFLPDVIIGQRISPQIELIYYLKDIYECNTAVVLHGDSYINNKDFPIYKYLKKVDKLGVRSKKHSIYVKNKLKLKEEPFICYSGIPDEYIYQNKKNTEKFDKISTRKFSFVGRLVKYKRVDVIIRALNKLENIDWQLDIVGDGAEKKYLNNLSVDLGCYDNVKFHGKVSRTEVMSLLSDSHCFIMVSENEVFGLAYLEAMVASCITIASKDGGIDGIIRNGDNGFLSNQGDEKNLFETINKIVNMDIDKIKEISSNAYDTAVKLKDSEVARKYLELVLEK